MLYGGREYISILGGKMNLNLLWERKYEIDLDLIKNVELYFDIKFPNNYVEIINSYDGYGLKVLGSDKKYYNPMIEVYKNRFEIVSFYQYRGYQFERNIEESEIVKHRENHVDFLPNPKKMIVFAATAGKHRYLFDYRENEKEPAILFWDTDEINEDAFKMDPEEYMEEYGEDIEVGKNDGFYKIADSFDEFMEKIVPFED